MGLLGKLASNVENHMPVSIRAVAQQFSSPNAKVGSYRGRAISLGLATVSLAEAILFLALATITKIVNAITFGKSSELSQLGTSFINQSKDRALASLYLLYGATINPERGMMKVLDQFDKNFENPEVLELQHLELVEIEAEEAERLHKQENFLYSFRL